MSKSWNSEAGAVSFRSRRRLATALVVVAAGAGTYGCTSQDEAQSPSVTVSVSSAAPDASSRPPSADAKEPQTAGSPSRTTLPADALTKSPLSKESASRAAEMMADARSRYSVPIKPAPPPVHTAPAVKVSKQQVTTSKSEWRLLWARGDMSGETEMTWVTEDVTKHGAVECTQKFRFQAGKKPARRPTMMMCWRISPNRSVIAIDVDFGGNPSLRKNLAAIEKKWNELG
jgi:hypothetical protein